MRRAKSVPDVITSRIFFLLFFRILKVFQKFPTSILLFGPPITQPAVIRTFGMKTRHNVIDVLSVMEIDTMQKDASGCSLISREIGAPITHRMKTLYTDRPMYLQKRKTDMA